MRLCMCYTKGSMVSEEMEYTNHGATGGVPRHGDWTRAMANGDPIGKKQTARTGTEPEFGRNTNESFGDDALHLWIAAEEGDAEAQYRLGVLCCEGDVVPQDNSEGLRWFLLAGEQGHADAQWMLGAMYRAGDGVPRNPAEAVRWFRRAAEQGHAFSQADLGRAYHDGEGVKKDVAEALSWYRLSAIQGYAWAQWFLGLACLDGDGAPRDTTAAANWFRAAALQGVRVAQASLGEMYYKGEGVPQDYVAAHAWLNLAVASGYEESVEDRDSLAARMTTEQIAEALREWRGSYGSVSSRQRAADGFVGRPSDTRRRSAWPERDSIALWPGRFPGSLDHSYTCRV